MNAGVLFFFSARGNQLRPPSALISAATTRAARTAAHSTHSASHTTRSTPGSRLVCSSGPPSLHRTWLRRAGRIRIIDRARPWPRAAAIQRGRAGRRISAPPIPRPSPRLAGCCPAKRARPRSWAAAIQRGCTGGRTHAHPRPITWGKGGRLRSVERSVSTPRLRL